MDWLQRQGDEISTALFTPPNVTLIPPTTLGPNAPFDGIDSFRSNFNIESVKQWVENMKIRWVMLQAQLMWQRILKRKSEPVLK